VEDIDKGDPNWLHNLEKYLTVVSWLDDHYDLFDKLQQTAEECYESNQKNVTAKETNNEEEVKKYFLQRDELRRHLKICKWNVEEHQSKIPPLNLPYTESPSTEGDECPRTPQRQRINPIPSGYIQLPVYRQTGGLETRGEPEVEEEDEWSNIEEGEKTEESNSGEKKTTRPMSVFKILEPEKGLQGIKIPKPPTLSGDSNNRTESRVDNSIKKVRDYLKLATIPTINQPAVIADF